MHLNSRERCALIERNLHLEKSCVRPNGSVDDRVCCLVSLSHKAVTKGCFRFFFVCVVRFCFCFCFSLTLIKHTDHTAQQLLGLVLISFTARLVAVKNSCLVVDWICVIELPVSGEKGRGGEGWGGPIRDNTFNSIGPVCFIQEDICGVLEEYWNM